MLNSYRIISFQRGKSNLNLSVSFIKFEQFVEKISKEKFNFSFSKNGYLVIETTMYQKKKSKINMDVPRILIHKQLYKASEIPL